MNKSTLLFLSMAVFVSCTTLTAQGDTIWQDRQSRLNQSPVMGMGILYRIVGQWNGPVQSDTPAGDYPKWYVDFRPVSPGQVSQYSTVDPSMNNYITFFIVKYKGQLKVALRTDALFQSKGCITYEIIQKVDEKNGKYVFADFQSGFQRAYTVFDFSEDQLSMKTYTNKFNKQKNLTLHTHWQAERTTRHYALPAIRHFDYPRAQKVKDFTNIFGNAHESIFFKRAKAPYTAMDDPYVGKIKIDISVADKLKQDKADELFVMLTTKPIIEGGRYRPSRLEYISKFIYLPAGTQEYTLTHVHPGSYYIYSYLDTNQDRKHKSGDYMSSRFHRKITVQPGKTLKVSTEIDYVIP